VYNKYNDQSLYTNAYNAASIASTDPGAVGSMFKDLLKGDSLSSKGGGELDPALLSKIVNKAIQDNGLKGTTAEQQAMDAAKTLSKIISNPTDDQKTVIDETTKLLTDMDNLEKDANANPELKKATDELLQAVANILLAQAIPDLLKEGDLYNIKNIFSNLDTAKSKIILEYNDATKPYYDEVKKIIEKNSEALYASNVLQKNPLQKELEMLPPSQIDRIIEKLKAKEKRTAEEEYILQQEAKYRQRYIEPNKKKLEESMKSMLQDFTKKLSTTLETTKKK
jgi:hypothetical protein